MQYKHILFDLDGTLTDSGPGIMNSARYALKKFGYEENDETRLRYFVGPPLTESFKRYKNEISADVTELVNAYREYYNDKGIFENSVYLGIEDLLSELLEKGKLLHIATTKPIEPAKRVLEHFSLTKFFTTMTGGGDNPAGGGKDVVIEKCLSLFSPDERDKAIMVGDRCFDITGAKKNNIDCVGVLYGYGSKQELTEAGAEYLVDTVLDLGMFLTGQQNGLRISALQS